MGKILIVGGTKGIGGEIARLFYSSGKPFRINKSSLV